MLNHSYLGLVQQIQHSSSPDDKIMWRKKTLNSRFWTNELEQIELPTFPTGMNQKLSPGNILNFRHKANLHIFRAEFFFFKKK